MATASVSPVHDCPQPSRPAGRSPQAQRLFDSMTELEGLVADIGTIFKATHEHARDARAKLDELAMLLGVDEDPDLDRVQTLVRELRDDHVARWAERA